MTRVPNVGHHLHFSTILLNDWPIKLIEPPGPTLQGFLFRIPGGGLKVGIESGREGMACIFEVFSKKNEPKSTKR